LTMDIRNCNLWSQGTRTQKIGVTQSLTLYLLMWRIW